MQVIIGVFWITFMTRKEIEEQCLSIAVYEVRYVNYDVRCNIRYLFQLSYLNVRRIYWHTSR
jgi:hypothetical protein